MNLDEVRAQIDTIDAQMKQLFLDRMNCAKHVAEAKIEMGNNSIFMLDRELAIIEKHAAGINSTFYSSYATFIRHLMSVSRRYQYGLMDDLRENAINTALASSGMGANTTHTQVKITFTCEKKSSDLNLFINMAKLNDVAIDEMNLNTENGIQKITLTLDGNVKDANMRQYLAQVAKEADNFKILELN